eukprot:CAMPEP_0198645964 /NCGR_PEP_ID=MMETSP1467-20131203/1528_1 /TAXON_ID=1462469 /ORGANISM="unid. sp., Strain CCMP2135" /LENGTH=191 /DNA_ID=CAMNT_0044381463 /DNA_START=520 /DNA_END=1095 /DNA_ORIENTATION=-
MHLYDVDAGFSSDSTLGRRRTALATTQRPLTELDVLALSGCETFPKPLSIVPVRASRVPKMLFFSKKEALCDSWYRSKLQTETPVPKSINAPATAHTVPVERQLRLHYNPLPLKCSAITAAELDQVFDTAITEKKIALISFRNAVIQDSYGQYRQVSPSTLVGLSSYECFTRHNNSGITLRLVVREVIYLI